MPDKSKPAGSFELQEWVEQIALTEAEEISCSECLDQVDVFVDAELAGAPLTPPLVQLKQHLGQCKVCREEYEMLRDLVREENEGVSPSIEELKGSA